MSTTHTGRLAAGQRLDRRAFHALYERSPGVKAELVGGEVYMASPVGRGHGVIHARVLLWLGLYAMRTPGVEVADNASTALDDLGEPQPDAWLRVLPAYGGGTRDVGGIIAGAPELVVEVADSSRALDLGPKRADYERAGVLEYAVVALDPDGVSWHARRPGGDRLERIGPGPDGLYRCGAFPGLWLDPDALLSGDGLALAAALDRGLATAEHGAFVAALSRARRGGAGAAPEC